MNGQQRRQVAVFFVLTVALAVVALNGVLPSHPFSGVVRGGWSKLAAGAQVVVGPSESGGLLVKEPAVGPPDGQSVIQTYTEPPTSPSDDTTSTPAGAAGTSGAVTEAVDVHSGPGKTTHHVATGGHHAAQPGKHPGKQPGGHGGKTPGGATSTSSPGHGPAHGHVKGSGKGHGASAPTSAAHSGPGKGRGSKSSGLRDFEGSLQAPGHGHAGPRGHEHAQVRGHAQVHGHAKAHGHKAHRHGKTHGHGKGHHRH